ncbi:MAG: DHH family phosphoesterase, partial [Ruminococcus sp.]|nr:DHH family phosphoesterase [Ruminococcus sp.]
MKNWTIVRPDRNIVQKLMTECGISSLTASVLASKGYSSPDSVMDNLELKELSDPFLIKDMKEAADTINSAIDNNERICVYGDYDCDGIMSTVILYSYLLETGADVIYYIPERSEGYGLNNKAIEKISEQGTKLIVTVDNGISAVAESEYIYSLGMKLVVTDHHQQGETLPRAEAVVDPHRHDCFSPFKYLCGAGVALKLIAALDGGDCTMALEQFGDLAAIATVADIVSLTGENRFLVSYGMELINNT